MISVDDVDEFVQSHRVLSRNNLRVTWRRTGGEIEIVLQYWDYSKNVKIPGMIEKVSKNKFPAYQLEEKLDNAMANVRVKIANHLLEKETLKK